MSGPWNDFNSAQSNTNVIPKGTLAKVRLTLRPGGFDDASQGWTGGWARRAATGSPCQCYDTRQPGGSTRAPALSMV
mgnify:CR=1 FL=1